METANEGNLLHSMHPTHSMAEWYPWLTLALEVKYLSILNALGLCQKPSECLKIHYLKHQIPKFSGGEDPQTPLNKTVFSSLTNLQVV